MERDKTSRFRCLSASALKLIAMVCMLCDHAWASVVPGNYWLTVVGRIAFPIFAFQIAEGIAKTTNGRAYTKRLFWMAVISELPFNLLSAGGLIYPFHQNVLFSFWLSTLILRRLKRLEGDNTLLYILNVVLFSVIGYVLGTILFLDFYGYGVLMVILFYVCRDLRWGRLGQLVGMVYINYHLMGGRTIPLALGSLTLDFPVQAVAVLALIPIWLYNGEKGKSYRWVRPLCYAFYPAHILILSLIAIFILH